MSAVEKEVLLRRVSKYAGLAEEVSTYYVTFLPHLLYLQFLRHFPSLPLILTLHVYRPFANEKTSLLTRDIGSCHTWKMIRSVQTKLTSICSDLSSERLWRTRQRK